jgi:PilZ domain
MGGSHQHAPERRVAERFSVRLPVHLDRRQAESRDLSTAGMRVVTDRPLAVGQELLVAMTLPGRSNSPDLDLRSSGRVVWVCKTKPAEAGIALDADDTRLLLAEREQARSRRSD